MRFREFVPEQRFQPTLAVSPDGSHVAFSANTNGQYDIWLAPLDGSTPARALTAFTDLAVRSVAWSRDGAQLAYAADQRGDEQHQIYLVDATPDGDLGEPRRLTTADDRQHELGASPFSHDGRFLAYAGNDRDVAVQDLLVLDLASGTARRIESEPGLLLVPIEFSPDDSRLLVLGARSNTDMDVMIVDLTDDDPTLDNVTAHEGEAIHMPAGWTPDGTGCYVVSDDGGEFRSLQVLSFASRTAEPFGPAAGTAWDVGEAATSTDGLTVVWTVNEGGTSVLHRHTAGVTHRYDALTGVIEPMTVTPDGSTVVALVNTATRPGEVTVIDVTGDGAEPRYLTDSRPPALQEIVPVSPELIGFPTHDEREIPGWLYRPSGDGPFPVVLSIHGGPEAQERPVYAYAGLYQYLLANGIGVLAPNVRGSTGYGRTYQTLIHRDWGGAELGDFEHANRYLRGLEWVDADRIAVFGGSFGGFATLSCVSRLPDLWAAGVSVVGPSNLPTFVRAVPPTWRALMATWVGDPDDDAEMLVERSPITYADDIVAPLMVVQGANDPRVVKAESDQIVESLRSRGVEVRYDVYDDEGHGFTKRENEIQALGDVAEFLIAQLTSG